MTPSVKKAKKTSKIKHTVDLRQRRGDEYEKKQAIQKAQKKEQKRKTQDPEKKKKREERYWERRGKAVERKLFGGELSPVPEEDLPSTQTDQAVPST